VYLVGLAGTLGYSFGGIQSSELAPTRSLLTRPGFRAYLKRAGLWVFLPSLVGLGLGINLYGNEEELHRLLRMSYKFEKEIHDFKTELYYT